MPAYAVHRCDHFFHMSQVAWSVYSIHVCVLKAWIRYDTTFRCVKCYFNVRSKADISQLNLPHGTDN